MRLNVRSLAFTGDSNPFFKPFAVLDHITAADPDLWLYIGDTIYGDDTRSGTGVALVRSDYHGKYQENREDRSLRDLMASVATHTIWDDHEVTNDFFGSDLALGGQVAEGNQAFRDWMPIREDPNDASRLYRNFKWGDVAEFFLIDVRNYRSAPADRTSTTCLDEGEPALLPDPNCTIVIEDPNRTYLGAAQLQWLKDGLQSSTATFKFVTNQCRQGRAENGNRHGQHHAHRHRPALVLRRKEQIDEDQRQREDDRRRAARLLLLEGHAGPLEAHRRR